MPKIDQESDCFWASPGGEVRLYHGDVIAQLAKIPARSVHCCVTSPPYFGLRMYLFDKAVVLRYDLTLEEQQFVLQELAKHGVKPRQSGEIQDGGEGVQIN